MADSVGDRHSVCIPTGFDPAGYPCVRSLGRRGIRTVVASEHPDVSAAASRFCDERMLLPSPYEDLHAYKDALVGIAARPDVRTIIPIRSHDTYLLTKYRDEFERYVSVTTPPPRMLTTVHDRIRLASAAASAGVAAPETTLVTEVEDWSPEQIIKSRYNLLTETYCGSYGPSDFETVKTIKHLRPGEKPDTGAVIDAMKHVPVVQEYIRSSAEYVFGALYEEGEAVATFQHRQIRGNSYTGGGGVYRETVSIPALEEAGRTLLDSLDYHGIACIEYLRDAETGAFVLTEINPRMWQSLSCAVLSGADFPYYYWLTTQGRSDDIRHDYEVGFGSHLLYGELGYLASIFRDDSPLVEKPSIQHELRTIAKSCYEMPYFDEFRLDDPLPFVYGVKQVITNRR